MEDFSDSIGSVFDDEESIDYTTGVSPEGEYAHARISGIDCTDAQLEGKRARLRAKGIKTAVNETANGLEVEAWV